MRKSLMSLVLVFWLTVFFGQESRIDSNHRGESIKIVTWNIQDLGRTKDSEEILLIAKAIKKYDLVAIQEVVAKDPAGVQSVAKIVGELNRMGSKWDYKVSNPTQSPSVYMSERYAYLWKTSKVTLLGAPYLDSELKDSCAREPFIARFKMKKDTVPFYVINFHSKKFSDNPQDEIKFLSDYTNRLGIENVMLAGDFNLSEKHEVWIPFYEKGYRSALKNTSTTLKRECKEGDYLNHAIDNVFYNSKQIIKINSGVIDLVENCENLSKARGVSDHLPVFMEFAIK